MDATASWPNRNLQSAAWRRIYNLFTEHPKMVKYIEERHVYLDELGLYRADFFGSILDLPAGISTYAEVALERLWGIFDDLHGPEQKLTMKELFQEFDKTFKSWKADKFSKELVTIPTKQMLLQVPSLLSGEGEFSVKVVFTLLYSGRVYLRYGF